MFNNKLLQATVCVVVPAYNEGQVILSSLKALCQVVSPEHIYVVSDGSTDNTVALAHSVVPNVLELKINKGKAGALQALIAKFSLTKKYQYILFADADSRLSPNFLNEVEQWAVELPACIVGKVTSDRHSLISAYRTYEYGLTNRVFKQAQHYMQVITVAPGCASLYRADVLAQLDFSNHTLTEDFDLTLQIHKRKLGRIVYVSGAQVITQDPPTFADYWKQITRWYTGFWQNIAMHKLYIPNKKVNFEILLLILDGIGWMASIVFAILHPLIFLYLIFLSSLVIWALSIIILSLEKKPWAMRYFILFPLFQYLNLSAFVFSFFRAWRGGSKKLSWQKVNRYAA